MHASATALTRSGLPKQLSGRVDDALSQFAPGASRDPAATFTTYYVPGQPELADGTRSNL